MGLCRYCHTKVGLFRDAHQECVQQANQARDLLKQQALTAVAGEMSVTDLRSHIQDVRSHLTDHELTTQLLRIVDQRTLQLALESPISTEDADRIYEIYKTVDPDWTGKEVVNWDGCLALTHSNTLYEILHGQVPYYNSAAFK